MLALLQKEINSFLNSLIGYIVILVFLLTISLFLWVFPATDFNVFETGYANIDSLFIITPWVYMFLIPAITMRLFAEEKKSGTIELLLTRPLTELQVILAKYFAGLLLVLFSLLPTLVYYI
jgi:ABC-2 type transport system permease protein